MLLLCRQDGVSCLNIAERYDTETGQWTRLAPMREKRLGVAVVVLNNLLYAIGGGNGGVLPLCSAERYAGDMQLLFRQWNKILRLRIVLSMSVQWTQSVIAYSHSNNTTKSFSCCLMSFFFFFNIINTKVCVTAEKDLVV